MHIILGGLLVLILLYAFSWSSNPTLRWISRNSMLVFGVGCLLLALACVGFAVSGRGSGAGVLLLVALFPGGIGLFVLSLWFGARDGEAYNNMSDQEQRVYTRKTLQEAREALQGSIDGKKARAERFFAGAEERYERKREIRQEKGLLKGVDSMADAYEEHLQRKDRGDAEPSLKERFGEIIQRLKCALRPPNRR